MNQPIRAGATAPALSLALPIAAIWDRAARALLAYFLEPTHPLNLAVVRIVIFGACLAEFNWQQLQWFSGLPRVLLFPPHSIAWLVPHIPIDPQLAMLGAVVFITGCVLAIIGLFTRWAALAVVLSGLYVLGIPELYGKVDNYHHLIWFAAILAFSPCADAWSIDAIRRAWQAADRDQIAARVPSAAYGLPLRLIWILLGIIYLFPGLWKARSAGLDWALGPGFLNLLYQKWFELGWWTPLIRIDQLPILLVAGALGVMLWEMSFIILIFPRRTRPIAVVTGTLFHVVTMAFMSIFFWNLLVVYVSFFDVAGAARRFGRKLFPSPMYIVYDGHCSFCRRAVELLRVVDVLERTEYVSSRSQSELERVGLMHLDPERLQADMHAVVGQRVWQGFDAYRAIAGRVPILWPLLPLSSLPVISQVGEAVYRRHADSRACRVETDPRPAVPSPPRPSQLVMLVGATLIILNAIAGWFNVTSWPISVYPTFMCCLPSTATVIDMEITAANGHVEHIVTGQGDAGLPAGTDRLHSLVLGITSIDDHARRQEALRALVDEFAKVQPSVAHASAISFYKDEFVVAPEHRGEPPVSHELLFKTAP